MDSPVIREIIEFPWPLDRHTGELVDREITNLQQQGFFYERSDVNEALNKRYITFLPPGAMKITVSDNLVKAEKYDKSGRLHRVTIAKNGDYSPEGFILVNPPISQPRTFAAFQTSTVRRVPHWNRQPACALCV